LNVATTAHEKALQTLKRYPVVAFFALSYAITWPAWALEKRGLAVMAFPGYFGPALAALFIAALVGGQESARDLLARLTHWRVPFKWWLVALLMAVGVTLLPMAASALFRPGEGADFDQLVAIAPQLAIVLVTGSLYGTVVAAGEELGWRGYALPLLAARHGALAATLMVGVFWGLWHLPLSFLYPQERLSLLDSVLYGLGVDLASVIYTWLSGRTGGSVLIASLFHGVYDVCLVVLGPVAQATLGIGSSLRAHVLLLGVAAAAIVAAGGLRGLSFDPTSPGQQERG
jgi:membrane protease YdiL (CAAX protease family)